jgi:hypothetical protein
MTGYISLPVYYKVNFALIQHHKYSLEDINRMYPFERDIYLEMLSEFLEKQKQVEE